jgi:hypothetical protein
MLWGQWIEHSEYYGYIVSNRRYKFSHWDTSTTIEDFDDEKLINKPQSKFHIQLIF